VLDISEASRARFRGPWSVYHVILSVVAFPLGLADESMLHFMREGFETPTISAYDSLRLRGPLTATAGLNAHPKLKLGPVLLPPYGPFFKTLVSHLAVAGPLPSDPATARGLIAEGVRRGDLFISLGDHDRARGFRSAAVTEDGLWIPMGVDVPTRGQAVLRAGFGEDPDRKVAYRILRNGQEVEWVLGPSLEWRTPGPGVYRVEVYRYGIRMGKVFFRLKPWIFANPIGLLEDGPGAE
jgi:hypothetical protein